MSELVQMRQRIKAVETIKKITHAMCLISMSTSAYLKNRLQGLQDYIHALENLRSQALRLSGQEPYKTTAEHSAKAEKTLIIIIGAQKGLCGSFNNQLFSYLHAQHPHHTLVPHDIIIVGKKAIDIIALTNLQPLRTFDHLTQATYQEIARKISHIIFPSCNTIDDSQTGSPYTSVTIISMRSITFFTHKGTTTHIALQDHSFKEKLTREESYDDQEDDIQEELERNLVHATLKFTLLTSMIAEQAARFIAMDGSTRNASNILETMKLNYNKLRQARITRELTDLAGSF